MRKCFVCFVLVMTMLVFVSPTLFSQTIILDEYQDLRDDISKMIHTQMKKQHVQGLSIALVDGERILWAEGFGYADTAKKIPVAPETIFRLGSISKVMTALSVLQLAENDQINLDQSFQRYLPAFRIGDRFGTLEQVTPRTLLTHHSGLPGDYLSRMWDYKRLDYRELISFLQNEYTVYPPNYIFAYSNLGYTLLGRMVEDVSGTNFVTYTEEKLFQPLGMQHTSFEVKPHMEPLFSKGYERGKVDATVPWEISVMPAGNLHSNVLDMSKFMQMVLGEGTLGETSLLSKALFQEMTSTQNLDVPLDLDMHVGISWFISDLGGHKLISHGGDTILYHSEMRILPDDGLGVIVLTNTTSGVNIKDQIAMETLKLALEQKTGVPIQMPEPPKIATVSRSTKDLKKYEGQYSTQAGLIKVEAKKGALYVNLLGTPLKLIPLENGGFAPRYQLFGFLSLSVNQLKGTEFYFEKIQERDLFIIKQGGRRSLIAERILPFGVSPVWKKRVGKYEFVNQSETEYAYFRDLQIVYEDGLLKITGRIPLYEEMGLGPIERVLRPLTNYQAVTCGLGRNMGDNVRVVEDEAGNEELHFAGYVFRRVAD